MALLQDPVLGYRVGAHEAACVYHAAPAPKNKISLQGPLRKVYSISNVYGSVLFSEVLGLARVISKKAFLDKH